MKKKILVMPPTADFTLRKRLKEIAFCLRERYDVLLFHWNETEGGNILKKARITLNDIFKRERIYNHDGINVIEYPVFHRPLFLVKSLNAAITGRIIKRHGIKAVINGVHYFLFTPEKKRQDFTHIFDINDIPVAEQRGSLGEFTGFFSAREIKKADTVTACSQGLTQYIRENYGRKPAYIPNGTYLEEFNAESREKAADIRRRYGLNDKYIIGYIGRVGQWIDMEFLIDVFRKLKNIRKDAALIVVGGGSRIESLKARYSADDIVFTGGIESSRITPYFYAIDMAVLPSIKNLFQDNAFHIKLIEYTAAGKFVLSTSLDEAERLKFPNILTAKKDTGEWLAKARQIFEMKWDPQWDNLVRGYDWDNIAGRFADIIESKSRGGQGR
jgi:glycosyltransferase involved in cell wall biosynthesis